MKTCRTCHRELSVSEFWRRRKGDGNWRSNECKACSNKKARERAANKKRTYARSVPIYVDAEGDPVPRAAAVTFERRSKVTQMECDRCTFYAFCYKLVNAQLALPPWERQTDSPPCFADSRYHSRYLKEYAREGIALKVRPEEKIVIQEAI